MARQDLNLKPAAVEKKMAILERRNARLQKQLTEMVLDFHSTYASLVFQSVPY